MQRKGTFVLAAFASGLSAITTIICPARVDTPLFVIARLLNVHTGSSCRGAVPAAHHILTVLSVIPPALLFGVMCLCLFPGQQHHARRLWLWSALFAALPLVPILSWALLLAVEDSDRLFRLISFGNVVLGVSVSAPAWTWLFIHSDEDAKRPSWFSDLQRAATVALIIATVLAGTYVWQMRQPATADAHECETPNLGGHCMTSTSYDY